MKKLSRNEMKNVMGGEEFVEDKACTVDSDCGTRTLTCGGVSSVVNGICRRSKCWWNVACAS